MRRQKIDSQVTSRIPEDIHTIVDHYDLDPTLHISIACPNCYALSPFTNEAISNSENALRANQPLPVCNERSHPDLSPCGATLWHTRRIGPRTFVTPIRKQAFQDLQEWIGRILAIPGLEDIIDQHQRRPLPSLESPERDFVDSSTFRCFKGADGQPYATPQMGPSGSPDLRLVMSLGFDAFNPFFLKEQHASFSSTALYMYMYLVTIIPGKPSRHDINHTLRRLVQQLLPFWEGVYYLRTARYTLGRTIFAVLIPAVCDTEGAHQLSGFASHSHTYFCRRCLLPIQDIHNLDPEQWVMRDWNKHRQLAFEWKEAPMARRNTIYQENGLRWSELLDLPYWDPIRFTVIDDMHLGYLGLFETHLREIWKIDDKKNGGNGLHPDTKDQKKISNASLRKFLNEIRQNDPSLGSILSEENKGVLWYLTFVLGLRTGLRTKKAMSRILNLTTRPPSLHSRTKSPKSGSSPRHVIGKDLLAEIWSDMKRTVLPNWIQPPPSGWGTSASGKLSADEYKVICSVSLVITLIRVWGYENDEGVESRRFKMLENFLDLVHSMRVLFFRETSQKSRAYYKSHILKYLRGVLELYPDFTLKPNHHHAVHIVTDLETMGPGHARSTPVFERINHSLQQLNTNRRLGEVEATMLTSYCRQANLQVILDHNTDLREEIDEVLTALTDIDREDHRGI
ncbi:hypothetical protein F5879DRAFT_808397, partial [Lentinula edodes]